MRQRILSWLSWLAIAAAAVFAITLGQLDQPVHAQDTLSAQVLRLLARVNTWTGSQTFQDVRFPLVAIPVDTAARLYPDASGNLYFNGALIAGAGGTPGAHTILSSTHTDTTAAAVQRGDLMTGQGGTPKWVRLGKGGAGTFVRSDGTDVSWSTNGSALTALTAANISAGTAPISISGTAALATALATPRAINGTNFDGSAPITVTAAAGTVTGTTLNATVVTSSLTSVGTLANLTVTNPITGSVSGSAASASGNAGTASLLQTPRTINGVTFSGGANIVVTAAAGTLSGGTLAAGVLASSLTSTGTLTGGGTGAGFTLALGTSTLTGVVPVANLGSGAADATKYLRGDGAWIAGGAGSVTSVGFSAPAIFSVASSPITSTGTIALSLATEVKNLIWAGPASGADAAPTFRVMDNADLPLSGVGAGTYGRVTVNTRGVVTGATAQAVLTTDVSGILPLANGGTGLNAAADDTVAVSSGAAWVARALPNCVSTGALNYTTATNLFSCLTAGGPTHDILSATHSDVLAAAVVRGSMIVGNATPKWSSLAIGSAGAVVSSNGTDITESRTIAFGSLAGASAPLTMTATWNDAAVTFTQWLINVTATASNAASLFVDYQLAGVSKYSVRKDGAILQAGIAFAALGTPANGTIVYCTDCTIANPCTATSTGAFAKRLNGVWVCN